MTMTPIQRSGRGLEYPEVLALSGNPELLVRLHQVRCSEKGALDLLGRLCSLFPLPVHLKVHFAGTRGRARRQRWEDGREVHRLTLPKTGRLRVGLVLHEYAHHLAGLNAKHGPSFVYNLDMLAATVAGGGLETTAAAAGFTHRTYTPRRACYRCGTMTTRVHSVRSFPCCKRCETLA